MKLAIISDIHLGKRQYRTDENNVNRFEQIGYRAFNENIDIILKEKPDLIINAGDIFETANPSVLAMTQYNIGMNRLKDIPTMAILGNHDFAFNNKRNNCSAPEMISHTYFANYDIKTVEINDVLFVMMPYIYDTAENISKYLEKCKSIAVNSDCSKKILVTHGVTERYYKDSLISDPIMLSDDLIDAYSLVIIGHIHTPYNYKQKDTLVISPGSMIDYQAYTDRTGPIFLDTDTMEWHKVNVKTPHIIKKTCNERDINNVLKNVTEDIYKITYDGNVDLIDNDLFINAKNIAVNLIIDVVQHEEEAETNTSDLSLNIYDWVRSNYPEYNDIFTKTREALDVT